MNIAHRERRGFTLIELLVVVAIVALLLSILLPSLAAARMQARRTRAAADLHQILLGYGIYQAENNGAVLFGYMPATLNGVPVVVHDDVSGRDFGAPLSCRYPWRLAPYCGNVWSLLHSHGPVPPVPSAGDSATEAFSKAYTLSLDTTFGINSVYVGGDQLYQGFQGPGGDAPNIAAHVVFKSSQVRRPGSLIVFAESEVRNGSFSDPTTGFHEVTAPHAAGPRWKVVGGRIEVTTPSIIGIPQGRYGDRTVTGFFDGHAEALRAGDLQDMRLWANNAESVDYDFVP